MQGKRIYTDAEGNYPYEQIEPGVYFFWEGAWRAITPNGLSANLSAHEVKEELDKTITVGPSIAVNNGQDTTWHGFLEHGVWREC